MYRRVTDDHLRAPITSHTFAHKQTWLFKAEGFSPYSETHTSVAKCPFDVHSASWENIASCVCLHQPGQQERSPEEEVMETQEVGVRGWLLSHVRVSG